MNALVTKRVGVYRHSPTAPISRFSLDCFGEAIGHLVKGEPTRTDLRNAVCASGRGSRPTALQGTD